MATISFIIPTIGRKSLKRTVDSIAKRQGDEILVIKHDTPSRTWGNAERKEGIAKAKGEYLAFIDDDDYYVKGHREIMERAIAENPGKPNLFRMQYPNGDILWKVKERLPGNVSTQMILVPNRKEMFYKYMFPGNTNMGDYYFIARWKFPEVIWREEIIVKLGHDDIAKEPPLSAKNNPSKTISFIIPTVGRPTLQRTLDSIEKWPGDKVLVIQFPRPTGVWGNAERQEGTDRAKCDYIAFIDDDDHYVKGHRKIMYRAIRQNPNVPILFKIQYPSGLILPRKRWIKNGNVSSQMMLVPNRKEMLSRWDLLHRWADFHFINRWKWPKKAIVWQDEVIVMMGHNDEKLEKLLNPAPTITRANYE